jgi:hypothetical protein
VGCLKLRPAALIKASTVNAVVLLARMENHIPAVSCSDGSIVKRSVTTTKTIFCISERRGRHEIVSPNYTRGADAAEP